MDPDFKPASHSRLVLVYLIGIGTWLFYGFIAGAAAFVVASLVTKIVR